MVLGELSTCIDGGGAILEGVVEYSNRMSTYRLELDAVELSGFEASLRSAGVRLDERDPSRPLDTDDEGYLLVVLSVVFPAEDGDRRVPNPDLG